MQTHVNPKQQFIEQFYNKRFTKTDNDATLAHLMHSTEREVLSGMRYVNELLQNADDAGKGVGNLAASFVVTQHYLIFSHNGKHFEEADIKGIADAANPQRKKVEDKDSIGNKGIGFKAVFTIADCVHIISNGYSFRFDKNYAEWKDNAEDTPWEIIPIWTKKAETAAEVLPYIDKGKVNFIFKFANPNKIDEISKDLQARIAEPKYLIFLRNLKQISFENKKQHKPKIEVSLQIEEAKEEKNGYTIKKLKLQTNNEAQSWYHYSREVIIQDEVKKVIVNSEAVPKKYKTNPSVKISLALQEVKEGIKAASYPTIFTYLPTEINYPTPFLINADFLLDPPRAQLQVGDEVSHWNAFLFNMVYYYQFEFMKYLSCNTDLWPYVTVMILDSLSLSERQLIKYQDSFQGVIKDAVKKHSIVRNFTGKLCLVASNSFYDKHQFFEKFGDDEQKKTCVNYDIVNPEVLVKYGTKIFDVNGIISCVKHPHFSKKIATPEKNRDFIVYLYQLYDKIRDKKIIDLLSERNLILSTKNELKSAKEIFLPEDSIKDAAEKLSFVNTIHKVLNAEFVKNPAIQQWLENSVGVRQPTLGDLIEKVNKLPEEIVSFTQAIYERQFEKEEENSLKKLKVRNGKGEIVDVKDCYLPPKYQPIMPLRGYGFSPAYFLSEKYLAIDAKETPIDSAKMRAFFLKIGIKQCLNDSNANKFITAINGIEGNLLTFTQMLFNFFCNTSNEKAKEHWEKIKKHFNQLKLVTDKGNFAARSCYLADGYKPEMKLENEAKALNYVSMSYVKAGDNIELWRKFFSDMGVKSRIEFKLVQQVSKASLEDGEYSAIEKGYLSFLEARSYPVEDYGTGLYPPVTFYYKNQHIISCFYRIDYIDQVIKTPWFWKIIRENLSSVSSIPVTYKTQRSGRPIPSSLEYYVYEAIKQEYKMNPADLYSPKIREVFDENELADFKIADVIKDLSDRDIAFLGFKQQLSLGDSLALLRKISTQVDCQSPLKKIARIYSEIAQTAEVVESKKDEKEAPLLLLNQTGGFVNSKELYAFVDERIVVNENSLLLKRPETLAIEDFKKLCGLLKVKMIHGNDLGVNLETQRENPAYKQKIKEVLPYLLLLESHVKDIDKDGLDSFVRAVFQELSEKIDKLIVSSAKKIQIKYKGVINQSVDVWCLEEKIIVLENKKRDFRAQKTICKYLHGYLGLSMRLDIFEELMQVSIEEFIKNYHAYNLSEACIALVKGIITARPASVPAEEGVPDEKGRGDDVVMEEADASPRDDRSSSKEEKASKKYAGIKHAANSSSGGGGNPKKQKTDGLSPSAAMGYGANDAAHSPAVEEGSSQDDTEMQAALAATSEEESSSPFTIQRAFFKPKASASASASAAVAAASPPPSDSKAAKASPATLFTPSPHRPGHGGVLPSKEQKAITGREGEQRVYDYLKQKYQTKYKEKFKETANGFTLMQANGVTKQVIWCNKDRESGEHYDFIVEKFDKENKSIKKRFIEVKTSRGNRDAMEMYFSIDEWKYVTEKLSSYVLYCVNNVDNANKDNWKVTKIKNLNAEVANGHARVGDLKKVTVTLSRY